MADFLQESKNVPNYARLVNPQPTYTSHCAFQRDIVAQLIAHPYFRWPGVNNEKNSKVGD